MIHNTKKLRIGLGSCTRRCALATHRRNSVSKGRTNHHHATRWSLVILKRVNGIYFFRRWIPLKLTDLLTSPLVITVTDVCYRLPTREPRRKLQNAQNIIPSSD